MLSQIKPLNQEERQNAHASAQQAVMRAVGERPAREQFNMHTASRYLPSVTKLINGLCIALLLAAFTPSAIRLFVIGSETFGAAVPDSLAMVTVGVATVLTAAIGQVVFSLALATMGTTHSARRLLYVSMGIATAITLVGNVQVALPGHMGSPFAWLEAIAPPLLVLSTAYVLKEQILDAIEIRHTNERAYQEAVNLWQSATADPENHPHWMQFYAKALRDTIRKANNRRRDALADLKAVHVRLPAPQQSQLGDDYLLFVRYLDTLLYPQQCTRSIRLSLVYFNLRVVPSGGKLSTRLPPQSIIYIGLLSRDIN